jgi:hypothetical protein
LHIKQSAKQMKLTKPQYSKSQVLEMAGITNGQFQNWSLRGLIPRYDLGFELVKLTKARYSPLIVAYCRLLTFHTGSDRKLYVQILKKLFKQIAQQNDFNHEMVIAISGFGKGKDCGLFENSQIAYQMFSRQCAIVPAGQIIKHFKEISNDE